MNILDFIITGATSTVMGLQDLGVAAEVKDRDGAARRRLLSVVLDMDTEVS